MCVIIRGIRIENSVIKNCPLKSPPQKPSTAMSERAPFEKYTYILICGKIRNSAQHDEQWSYSYKWYFDKHSAVRCIIARRAARNF